MSEVIGENVDDTNPEVRVDVGVLQGDSPPHRFPFPTSGTFTGLQAAVLSTRALNPGQVWYSPVWLPGDARIGGFLIQATVLSTGGGVIRAGLYTRGVADRPDALVADFGTVTTDTVGGADPIEIDLSGSLVPVPDDGWYWLAMVVQGTPATAATFQSIRVPSGIPLNMSRSLAGYNGTDPVQNFGWISGDLILGALPEQANLKDGDLPPNVASLETDVPRMFVRLFPPVT
jgi:hypothetical protein